MEEFQISLEKAIKSTFDMDFTPEITPSPANIEADFSTNAPLKLAKELRLAPMEIAQELAAVLPEFTCTITNPGFLNFTLSPEYLQSEITKLDQNYRENISSDEYSGKAIVCEFSDPNPFKVLHVGHLYTSIVGDSISRLFEYAGAKVIRANFGGDVGLHVAKTMYTLEQKDLKSLQIEDIAKCYIEGTAAYDAKDVGLIFTKQKGWNFDRSIVITGNEQQDYMKVVLKSIEQYAPDLVAKTTHLTHGLVKLPGNVKMSSRQDNFLKAVDVLEMVQTELKEEYNSTDQIVVLAATKYAFLKYKMGGNIIFDPKESVKMTGNSGPYLLYSAVRAKCILGIQIPEKI